MAVQRMGIFASIVLAISLAACTVTVEPDTELVAEPTIAPTVMPDPTPIPVFAPTATPEAVTLFVTVMENANVRVGPGDEYAMRFWVMERTPVKVAARSPDGRWLEIAHGDLTGWVAAAATNIAPADLATLREAPPAADDTREPEVPRAADEPEVPTPVPETVIEPTPVAPTPAPAEDYVRPIISGTVSWLFVHLGPSEYLPVVGAITKAASVHATHRSEDGQWLLINSDDVLMGWVMAAYTNMEPEIQSRLPTPAMLPIPEALAYVRAFITAGRANLRDGPGTEYPVDTQLWLSDLVYVVGRNWDGSWLQIVHPDPATYGKKVWVFAELTDMDAQTLRSVKPVDPPRLDIEAPLVLLTDPAADCAQWHTINPNETHLIHITDWYKLSHEAVAAINNIDPDVPLKAGDQLCLRLRSAAESIVSTPGATRAPDPPTFDFDGFGTMQPDTPRGVVEPLVVAFDGSAFDNQYHLFPKWSPERDFDRPAMSLDLWFQPGSVRVPNVDGGETIVWPRIGSFSVYAVLEEAFDCADLSSEDLSYVEGGCAVLPAVGERLFLTNIYPYPQPDDPDYDYEPCTRPDVVVYAGHTDLSHLLDVAPAGINALGHSGPGKWRIVVTVWTVDDMLPGICDPPTAIHYRFTREVRYAPYYVVIAPRPE